MNIDTSDEWKKIFTNVQTCDFCLKSSSLICRVIIHPVRKSGNETLVVDGVVIAKKCFKCSEE